MAERARPGLGRTLIDRDHAALRHHESHQVGDRVAAPGRRDIADRLRGNVVGFQRRGDFFMRRRRAAIERVGQGYAARRTGEMGQSPGRADGDTGVARRRGHPEMKTRLALLCVLEPGFVEMFEQPHVAERIQRHTAGEYQPVRAG